jgi:hypothetical protein
MFNKLLRSVDRKRVVFDLQRIAMLFPKTAKPTKSEIIAKLEKFNLNIDAYMLDIGDKTYWKRVSGGERSDVYLSPCRQYILKINTVEDSYPFYAYLAITQPENPYLPKVYWHASPSDKGEIKSLTLMENLKEITRKKLVRNNEIVHFRRRPYKYILGDEYLYQLKGDWKDYILGMRHLSQFIDLNFDMVSFNFMRRGKQVVITDPII